MLCNVMYCMNYEFKFNECNVCSECKCNECNCNDGNSDMYVKM